MRIKHLDEGTYFKFSFDVHDFHWIGLVLTKSDQSMTVRWITMDNIVYDTSLDFDKDPDVDLHYSPEIVFPISEEEAAIILLSNS